MKYLKSGFVIAAAMIGASTSVLGAAGEFSPVTVTALQTNVTYSTTSPALETYAGFVVSGFTNQGTINTINDLVVTFEASVTDGAENLKLHNPGDYLTGLPAGCEVPTGAANPLTITCKFKQVKGGEFSFPAFTVFYKVPVKVTNGVAEGGANPDYINTKHTILYAEGENDCANGCANSRVFAFGDPVLLGTTNATTVKSGVPKNGGTFFTGVGLATAADPWLTRVVVPGNFTTLLNQPYTVASILEAISPSSCSPVNLQCNRTVLMIPGTFSSLEITLQQHPSIIKPGSKIGDWRIAYSSIDPTDSNPEPTATDLQYCLATNPPGPSVGVPCLIENSCKEYTRKSDPLLPQAWGIFECKIKALTNGYYKTR